MYWSKLKFEGDKDYKKFNVNFSDGDRLDGVFFRKDKKYFITSLSTNIKIEKNFKKLEDYEKLKKVSKELNDTLKNGSQYLHEDIELKIENVNELIPLKTKRKLATKSLEFFDENSKKKKKVLIYSPYKELKFFGLKFIKENGIIDKYHINLVEDEKNNLFLEKKIFYDRDKIVEKIRKQYLLKNLIFMEENGKLIVQPIDFVEFLTLNIEAANRIEYLNLWKNDSKFKFDLYRLIFGGYSLNPKRKRPKIIQKGQNVNDSHPIAYDGSNFKIKGGINFYIMKELYDRKQSIFRKIPEIPEKIVTAAELTDLRTQLNDNSFTVSKLYGFRNKKNYSIYLAVNTSDFAIPDFNVKVETKKNLADNVKYLRGHFLYLTMTIINLKKQKKFQKRKGLR